MNDTRDLDRELEDELRSMLQRRAGDVTPTPDAWRRFVERSEGVEDDVVPIPTTAAPPTIARAARRWPSLAAAAAVVVALVAGIAVTRDGDVEQSTAAGVGEVADAPDGAIPPGPDATPPGDGGPAVFGMGEGFVDARAAAKAYLTDRLPDAPGLVMAEPAVEGDLARVRWASFEDGPIGDGPIDRDPIAAGTIFLWQPEGPGGEWIVLASLLDAVAVEAVEAIGSTVRITGVKTTAQATDLTIRPLDGATPPPEAGNQLPDGSFDERRTLDAPDPNVVVIRVIGGTTLGISELPFARLGVAVGPVAAADSGPAEIAVRTVEEVLGRDSISVEGAPGTTDFRYLVGTATGTVVAEVGPVVGGIGVTAMWDAELGDPSASVVDGAVVGTVPLPGPSTVRLFFRTDDGFVGERSEDLDAGTFEFDVSLAELGAAPGDSLVVLVEVQVNGTIEGAMFGVA